jgi:flagellum-specific peptidoglycan hydrolase FlgJ
MRAEREAESAGHIYSAMAACEAALESGWGTSELARKNHNLFGMKQHAHPVYGTVQLPTDEFEDAKWKSETDGFVVYPDDASCFRDRMQTLRSLSTTYPHYALALAADTPEEYVTEVSRKWSTDPQRAAKCITIFHAHADLLEKQQEQEDGR